MGFRPGSYLCSIAPVPSLPVSATQKAVLSSQACAAGCVNCLFLLSKWFSAGAVVQHSSSSRLKAAVRLGQRGCLSSEVKGAGLNQLFT